jgi:hypothetical protein
MVNQKEKGMKYLRPASRFHLRIHLQELRKPTINFTNGQYIDSHSYWILPEYTTHIYVTFPFSDIFMVCTHLIYLLA